MKQFKTSLIIGSGKDACCYILLTIPDKDCLHSSLVTGPVPRFVLGPVSGAVPTGTVLGVAPGQATAPPVLSFPMLKNRIVIY